MPSVGTSRRPGQTSWPLRRGAVEITTDKQGRILIPAWLQEAASLEGRVLLVGNIDRIELWNPARFHEVVRTGTGEFEKFSNQIFG